MEERYHATTQNRFYPDMSDANKIITVEAKLISSHTYCMWSNTQHVSDCLSVNNQEFKTIKRHMSNRYCQDTAMCLLTSSRLYLFNKCLLLYVQSSTPDDGRKNRPKHVECYSKQNKFETYLAHTPTNTLFINLFKSIKFTLKYTIMSLLHVSVFNDHHQGALSVPK